MGLASEPNAARAGQLLMALSGRQHVLFPGRASAGIVAVLSALGLRDQWVVIPANVCYIVGWAVLASGNRPFLADVDPATGNLSIDTLDRLKLDQIGALIACHMYGLPAPMSEIAAWSQEKGTFLIEDAALALGAQAGDRPAGAWGDVSLFSFGSGKIVDLGNGGALLTDDAALAAEIDRALARLPEWSPRLEALEDQWLQIYWALHQFETANPRLPSLYPSLHETFREVVPYRLPDFPYADLAEALDTLSQNLAHRREIASIYQDELAGLPAIRTLAEPPGSITWRYPLLVGQGRRDELLRHLWAEGFHEVTRWYPSLRHMLSPLTPEPCFDSTPGADRLGDDIINLPVDADIDPGTARWLAHTISGFLGDRK